MKKVYKVVAELAGAISEEEEDEEEKEKKNTLPRVS